MKTKHSIFFTFLILSCTPSLHQLKINDDFTSKAIINNTIYISPIINNTVRDELDYCDNIIYQNFKVERPYFKKVYDTGFIRDMASKNNDFSGIYEQVRELYKYRKFVEPTLITELAKHLEPGYIVFSKIDSYVTEKKVYRNSLDEDKEDRYLITTVKGDFTVFNLQNGKIEFDADHSLRSSEGKTVHSNCLNPIPYSLGLSANSEFSNKPNEIIYTFYHDILKNFPKK
jgi:hypothetical protein